MGFEAEESVFVMRPYWKESVYSWIIRVCFNFGIEPYHFFEKLEVDINDCAEGFFTQKIKDRIERTVGYSCDNFRVNVKITENLKKSGLDRSYFQKIDVSHRTMFRFCPKCLEYDQYPYFRLDWCFQFVRYCIHHKCLLESTCPICSEEQYLPFTVFERENLFGGNISSLVECNYCGYILFDVEPLGILKDLRSCPLSVVERQTVRNGMATMASMVFGYGESVATRKKIGLRSIGKMVVRGLTPNSQFGIDADKVRERLQLK